MRILYLGTPVPVSYIDEQNPKCHFTKVGSIGQTSVLTSIKSDKRNSVRVITASPYGKKCTLKLDNNIEARAVSNLRVKSFAVFLISLIPSNILALFSELQKMKKEAPKEKVVIITLNTFLPFSLPILLAKVFYKDLLWCPYLIDAVEAPHYKNPLFRIADKFSVWAAKRADASITHNVPNSVDYVPNKPYLELFFGVNKRGMQLYKKAKPSKNKKFTIAYAGALTDIYNFKAIIEVIEATGKKYRWVFAGYGPNEDIIKKLSLDPRYDVGYLGILNHKDIIKLHTSADLLLCLRLSGGTKINSYSAKYAASGKLSEYLCSGKPILSSDIEAISPQFKPFLNFAKDSSAKSVQCAVEDIIEDYTNKLTLAKNGQKFAFQAFDESYQSEQINNFLYDLS